MSVEKLRLPYDEIYNAAREYDLRILTQRAGDLPPQDERRFFVDSIENSLVSITGGRRGLRMGVSSLGPAGHFALAASSGLIGLTGALEALASLSRKADPGAALLYDLTYNEVDLESGGDGDLSRALVAFEHCEPSPFFTAIVSKAMNRHGWHREALELCNSTNARYGRSFLIESVRAVSLGGLNKTDELMECLEDLAEANGSSRASTDVRIRAFLELRRNTSKARVDDQLFSDIHNAMISSQTLSCNARIFYGERLADNGDAALGLNTIYDDNGCKAVGCARWRAKVFGKTVIKNDILCTSENISKAIKLLDGVEVHSTKDKYYWQVKGLVLKAANNPDYTKCFDVYTELAGAAGEGKSRMQMEYDIALEVIGFFR